MAGNANVVIETLNRQFLTNYPSEACEELELFDPQLSAKLLSTQPTSLIANMLEILSPDIAASIFKSFPNSVIQAVLTEASPNLMINLLGKFEEDEKIDIYHW